MCEQRNQCLKEVAGARDRGGSERGAVPLMISTHRLHKRMLLMTFVHSLCSASVIKCSAWINARVIKTRYIFSMHVIPYELHEITSSHNNLLKQSSSFLDIHSFTSGANVWIFGYVFLATLLLHNLPLLNLNKMQLLYLLTTIDYLYIHLPICGNSSVQLMDIMVCNISVSSSPKHPQYYGILCRFVTACPSPIEPQDNSLAGRDNPVWKHY